MLSLPLAPVRLEPAWVAEHRTQLPTRTPGAVAVRLSLVVAAVSVGSGEAVENAWPACFFVADDTAAGLCGPWRTGLLTLDGSGGRVNRGASTGFCCFLPSVGQNPVLALFAV